MSELPQSWAEASIADVTTPFISVDPTKTPDQAFQYVDIGSIDNKTQTITDPKSFVGRDAPSRARRLICSGDTLFSTVRTYLKNIALVPDELNGELTSTGIAVLRPSDAVDAGYLFRWACSDDFVGALSSAQDGTMYPAVSDRDVAAASIPLPPLPEQRRIVAKIDSVTGKSRRARDHLDHIPRLVEKYKQAVLAAAFSEAQSASGHPTMIGDVASEVRNGLSKKPTDGPGGTPILRISAVRPRQVRVSDVRYYPSDEVPASAMLRVGDLLFTRYNGNPEFTAVCGQVRDVSGELTYPDKLIRVRLRDGVDPSFVELMCTSLQARHWLTPHIKSAAGQHGISGADLKRLPIPVPSLATQSSMVRRIDTLFGWIDRLASDATSARRLIDRLDQAVLAKAFRGELVPQDPADEPASVLLERIRTERGAAPKAKRGRKAKVA